MRFDSMPIWAVFAATFAVVMAAIEVGYRLGGPLNGGPRR